MNAPTTAISHQVANPWVRLMRPRQWTKNLLVFAAPLGAGVLTDTVVAALAVFASLCLASSSVYIFNDLADTERDRLHPTKRTRPLAAGLVDVKAARVVAIVLAALALGLALTVNRTTFGLAILYLAIMYLYTVRLKHIPVLELLVVTSGFVFRAVAGGTGAEVRLSSWFLIVISFAALFVVTGKRYSELVSEEFVGANHRPSLGSYTTDYLRHILGVSSGLAVIAYCLWAFETPVGVASETVMRLSIIPFVATLLRYGMVIFEGQAGEPEEVILGDRQIILWGGLWLGLFATGVYLA